YFSYFTTGEEVDEATNNPMYKPLKSPDVDEPIAPIDDGIQRGAFALSKNNPSPEASIRWLDYFYSEEGGAYIDQGPEGDLRSEEHTSELQSRFDLVCRLLLEK